jgi:hypothetical protein
LYESRRREEKVEVKLKKRVTAPGRLPSQPFVIPKLLPASRDLSSLDLETIENVAESSSPQLIDILDPELLEGLNEETLTALRGHTLQSFTGLDFQKNIFERGEALLEAGRDRSPLWFKTIRELSLRKEELLRYESFTESENQRCSELKEDLEKIFESPIKLADTVEAHGPRVGIQLAGKLGKILLEKERELALEECRVNNTVDRIRELRKIRAEVVGIDRIIEEKERAWNFPFRSFFGGR